MRAYWQLTLAQLRIFSRNRSVIIFTLIFPLLLMLALGSFSGNRTSSNVAVVDLDRSEASAAFVQELEDGGFVKVRLYPDLEEAKKLLDEGDYAVVAEIPAGYGARLDELANESEPIRIQTYYNETNQNQSNLGLDRVDAAADAMSKQLQDYRQLIVIEPIGIQAVSLEYVDFLVPGIVAMMIMSTNLNGVAGQISSWRERGILRRMQSTTLKASTFISAQITARMILNAFQAFLVVLIGYLFFRTQMNGSWVLLLGFVILGTLTFMSIGFIIAALAKTPESAAPIAGVLFFPMMFLGNIFFPVSNMPDALKPIVHAIPVTHLAGAMRSIMNLGSGLADVWVHAAVLGGWMIVSFAIASRSFKWD